MASLGAPTIKLQTTTTLTTTSFDHEVVAGTNLVVVKVVAHNHASGNAAPSGVTLNGVALSPAGLKKQSVHIAQNWYLPAALVPAPGTYSIVVTWPSQGIRGAVISAENGTGFHTIPLRATATHNATGVSAASVSVVSAIDDVVVDAIKLGGSRSDMGEGAGQTDSFIYNNSNGSPTSATYAGSKKVATGALTPMSWAWATGDTEFVMASASFIPADVAPPVIGVNLLQAEVDPVNRSSYVTGSRTVTAGRAVFIAIMSSGGALPLPVPTVSGLITWFHRDNINIGGATPALLTVYSGIASVGATGSVTIDFGGVSRDNCAWILCEAVADVAQSIIQHLKDAEDSEVTEFITNPLAPFASSENRTLAFFGLSGRDATISSGNLTIFGQDNSGGEAKTIAVGWGETVPVLSPQASWGGTSRVGAIYFEIKQTAEYSVSVASGQTSQGYGAVDVTFTPASLNPHRISRAPADESCVPTAGFVLVSVINPTSLAQITDRDISGEVGTNYKYIVTEFVDGVPGIVFEGACIEFPTGELNQVNEVLTLNDSWDAEIIAAPVAGSIVETVTIDDTVSGVKRTTEELIEGLSIGDSVDVTLITKHGTVSESVSLNDLFDANVAALITGTVLEALRLDDSPSVLQNLKESLVEAIEISSAEDNSTTVGSENVVDEELTLSVIFSATFKVGARVEESLLVSSSKEVAEPVAVRSFIFAGASTAFNDGLAGVRISQDGGVTWSDLKPFPLITWSSNPAVPAFFDPVFAFGQLGDRFALMNSWGDTVITDDFGDSWKLPVKLTDPAVASLFEPNELRGLGNAFFAAGASLNEALAAAGINYQMVRLNSADEWEYVPLPIADGTWALGYAEGIWLAGGLLLNKFLYSLDGLNWTEITDKPFVVPKDPRAFTHFKGQYYAVGWRSE